MRGINHKQKDAVQQLFESSGWPWNVEVTNVCETESTVLSICFQMVLASNLLSLKIDKVHDHQEDDLADRNLSEFCAKCRAQVMV